MDSSRFPRSSAIGDVLFSVPLLLAVSCGGASGGKDLGSQQAALTGRVLRADDETPLKGAAVTAPDGSQTKTDSKGAFSLDYKIGKNGQVEAKAASAAPVKKPIPPGDGYVELAVKAYDAKAELDVKSGGEVKAASGAAVKIPGGKLRYKDGSAPSGKALVAIAAPDPNKPRALDAVPGNFEARKDAARGKLSVESPVYVSVREDDKDLELKGGKATLELPVREHKLMKATTGSADLYFYDEDQGLWVLAGSAQRTTNAAGFDVYVAQVGEFGWWTVGTFFGNVGCVRGCVLNAKGKAQSGAQIEAGGVDVFSASYAYTGTDGCYAIDLPANQTFALGARYGLDYAVMGQFTSPSAGHSAAVDASKCKLLPELQFGAPGAGLVGADASVADASASADAGAFPFPGFSGCQGGSGGSSASTCSTAQERAYSSCLLSNCGAQYDQCFGSQGACRAWFDCFSQCNCTDTNCLIGCGAPANTCTDCLNAWNVCGETSCPAPACLGQSASDAGVTVPPFDAGGVVWPNLDAGSIKNCADLAACCERLTNGNTQNCLALAQQLSGTANGDSMCVAAAPSVCP